ncbi:MAG TPA: helix-turn-helix transcriptional regulator [Streptosporangiaceae bacterium]|nr:helix-turn-helix transcriptional regulator [Streptosporangiaceae bacterium]
MTETGDSQLETLGSFIRSKRKLANMSLRQLAERTRLSNPYLSQIERGLHQPSVRVIRLISDALNVSAESLLAHAGLLRHDRGGDPAGTPSPGVEEAIRGDGRLSAEQQSALIAVFRSMLSAGSPETMTGGSGVRTSRKADNASPSAITLHQRD